ncbi:MAG: glycosyl hydrolase [Candidatus Freyarchaeota archaeon]|nr:glycosyl hydrolase [Candidatus Jordarchaeia archaeon]
MDFDEFKRKMTQIKQRGYVDSHRSGPTGIGKTLEDLLGIKENNIAGPNFSNYELKSGRKNATSMLTLFTKSPEPKGVNSVLLEMYGYESRKKGISGKELHVTVDSIKPNSVGLQLTIEGNRLYIANNPRVKAYYEENTLKKVFEAKYHKLIYVLADNQWKGRIEQFWFNEAYLLDGFSFERFSELVNEGLLKVDIRMGHYPNGRIHDHGTGFRILPKYLPRCFETIQRVL